MIAGRMAGQTTRGESILAVIDRFNSAFNRQDIEATMAVMTEDCVFENTSPAPDGTRCVGQDAVRREFAGFFASSPSAAFEVEEQFAGGDHGVVRWTYRWVDTSGMPGHIRGVDVFRVRDGKVAEKLSYVKG